MVRKMKDSGVSGIGLIPSNYNISRIKYIADIYGRIGFRGYTQQDLVEEGEGPITLSPSNFCSMKMNYKKCSYLTWEKYYESPEIMIQEGDVLFVKTGSTYGKSCYVEELPMECTINPQLIVFKNIKGNAKWFSYFLQTEFIKNLSELAVVGGAIPTMSQEKIGNFVLIIPPKMIQDKIVDYLDKKCAEIDSLLSDIQSQIHILEDYKKSVITEAVTKGLNPDVEMKDSGIEWIGETPSDWEITHFKYVGIVKSNLVNVGLYQDYPQISPDNIAKDSGILLGYNTVEESGVISDNHLFYKGQILYSKIRPKLNKAIIAPFDGLCSADMYPIETNKCSKFILYVILSQYFLKQVALVTEDRVKMPKINQEELGRIYVVLPVRKKQEEIVKYLDSKCSKINEVIEDKQKQLEVFEQYKKSLIYEYVTGKKEVSDK